MALTSILGKTVFVSPLAEFRALLTATVGQGALISPDSSSDGWKLADQSDSVPAWAIAMQAGVSGDTVWACQAASVEISDTGSSTCAASGDVGSALYLGESGDVSLSAGATYPQLVGYVSSTRGFQLVPQGSISGSTLTVTGNGTVGGNLAVTGTLSAGGDGLGTDFSLYGDVASYKVWFDANADTNGTWYFGADDYGVDVILYGRTASAAVSWDASTDDLIWTGVARAILGTSGAPLVVTQGSPIVDIYATCASTHASNSVESFYCKTTMTGIAGVGGRARFHMYTNVALGGWANALKAYTEFGSSGRITGLASALCAEMYLEAGCTQGNYAPLESEIVLASGGKIGTASAFLYCNVTDDAATFNTSGYLFILGTGVVDTANGLFDVINADDIDACAALKIKIGATDYFIPLSTSIAFTA